MIQVYADETCQPFTVYAADATPPGAPRAPVVAFVVGWARGRRSTEGRLQIMKLPPAVTQEFTPYAGGNAKPAERARAQHATRYCFSFR